MHHVFPPSKFRSYWDDDDEKSGEFKNILRASGKSGWYILRYSSAGEIHHSVFDARTSLSLLKVSALITTPSPI